MKLNLKPIEVPTLVDRVATIEEIRAAVLPCSDPIEEYVLGLVEEIPADVGGFVRVPAIDFEESLRIEDLIEKQTDDWVN